MADGVSLSFTFDCHDATALAHFWGRALGYEVNPAPPGWTSWQAWLESHAVPEAERDDVARIAPPPGADGPRFSFLRVPEDKSVKNRLHPDLQVSGGRQVDPGRRQALIEAKVADLVAHGAAVETEVREGGHLDHVVLIDPEGNEFCVV